MKTRTLAFVIASLASAALFAGEYDDLTVPSKAGVNEITASSGLYSGTSAAAAFASDSVSGNRCMKKDTSMFIQYRFADGTIPVATNYSLMPPNTGGAAYAPQELSLYGSNTGADWVLLDKRTGLSWTDGERKYFPFENKKPYLWYKWVLEKRRVGLFAPRVRESLSHLPKGDGRLGAGRNRPRASRQQDQR